MFGRLRRGKTTRHSVVQMLHELSRDGLVVIPILETRQQKSMLFTDIEEGWLGGPCIGNVPPGSHCTGHSWDSPSSSCSHTEPLCSYYRTSSSRLHASASFCKYKVELSQSATCRSDLASQKKHMDHTTHCDKGVFVCLGY